MVQLAARGAAPQPVRTELQEKQDVAVSLVPIMIVMYATLLPREVQFNIGGLMMYADRMALIITLPWVIYKMAQGAIRFVLPDFLMLIAAFWMVIALWYNYGAEKAFVSGGSVALDATVGYYLARISFRSLTAIRRTLIVLAPGVFAIGLLMAFEAIFRYPIIAIAAESVFGALPRFLEGADASRFDPYDPGNFRIGMMRAKGPFSHSIHAGIYMASLGALYGMSGLRGWPGWFGKAAAIFSVFSLSSAAIGSLVINYGSMFYDWLQRRVRELSWPIGFISFGVFLFVVQLTTNIGAIGFVQRYLVFDTSTSFFREMIWDYGMQSIWKHPWFGIGFEEYERPSWMVTSSVDAHWLLLAMRYGIVEAVTVFAATLMAIIAVAKASKHVPYVDQRFYRGIAIALAGFGMMMFTVTLWGSVQSWFNLLLGACVACAQRSYNMGYQPPIVSDAQGTATKRPARPALARTN